MIKLAALAVLLLPSAAQAAASLAAMDGKVAISDASGLQPAKLGRPLAPGSSVSTGPDSWAVIAYSDGSKVRLGALTQLKLHEHDGARTGIELLDGLLDAWVAKVKGRRFRVKAAASVASVRGTVLRARNDKGSAVFSLFEGELAVTDTLGRTVILSPGQRVAVTERGLGAMSAIPAGESKAPAEPAVQAPPAKAETPAPAPAEEPAESLPAEAPAPAAATSPSQETETAPLTSPVSPSAP